MSTITIRRAQPEDKTEWLRMRLTLWPDQNAEEALVEMDRFLADPLTPIFVAVRADGKLAGFLEGGLRKYAEGCDSSPVAYLEGWFVDEELRRQGVGRGLVRARRIGHANSPAPRLHPIPGSITRSASRHILYLAMKNQSA